MTMNGLRDPHVGSRSAKKQAGEEGTRYRRGNVAGRMIQRDDGGCIFRTIAPWQHGQVCG
jgi:hypothetical protein